MSRVRLKINALFRAPIPEIVYNHNMPPELPNQTGEGLPIELTPFVGRQNDLARLCEILADPAQRLVTLLGPGGVGKTRLAVELIPCLRPVFKDGIVFVPLGDFSSPTDFLPAVLAALGIQQAPGSSLLKAICDHLAARQVLLILDNFEAMGDGALAVRDLLASAPGVKVLATAREKLNLQSEVIYRLSGLELPPPDAPLPAGEYDAVRLFVQKARQADPDFTLSAANAADVLRICSLVDGVPLALLLAGAWAELFSAQEIASQIEGSLDFLSGQQLDIPLRHRSLRAVFDSSFDRLDENLQNVFMRLSVFRAGFSLPEAGAVAGADLPALLALVNKSLLRRDPATGRYSFHNLLGLYAAEKLSAAGEFPALRKAHAAFFLDLLSRSGHTLRSEAQLAALDTIQADFENVKYAWTWAVDQGDFTAIRGATRGLYAFCDFRGRYYEGEALFRQAWQGLSPVSGKPPHLALALLLLSWIDLTVYIENPLPFKSIVALAQACLSQAQQAGDPEALAASEVLLGALAESETHYPEAIQLYTQGLHSDPSLDDFYWINLRLGLAYQLMEQYDPAIQYFQQSLQRGKTLGERVKIGWSLYNIGETRYIQGDTGNAAAPLRQALGLFMEIGSPSGLFWTNYNLGRVALASGDRAAAKEHAEIALQVAGRVQSPAWINKSNELLRQINAAPPPTLARAGQALVEPLSERELEVLRLLKTELSGPEIADQLMVSLNTVRYHTKNIYQKLQVNTRREALARARELGL